MMNITSPGDHVNQFFEITGLFFSGHLPALRSGSIAVGHREVSFHVLPESDQLAFERSIQADMVPQIHATVWQDVNRLLEAEGRRQEKARWGGRLE